MKLEIRNLQSSSTYQIDPEGAILGREGSKADIVLRDQAVSKKHAKIYEKNGRWYLEDLASSNGTFIDNRRITEPVVLNVGSVFALSENQFEVVQVLGANGKNGKASLDLETDGAEAGGFDGEERSSRPMKNNTRSNMDSEDMPPDEEVKGGVGYFLIAVPKAIAYYMGAVPLMALNPIGTIKKSVDNQRFPAMKGMPLAAYAIPAFLFSALLQGVVTIIVLAVNVGVGAAFGGIISLVISAAIAVVVGVVVGFIAHPVFDWILTKILKGESDERSRTNYFITSYTAQILFAVPGAVTALLAILMRIPYVGGLFGILPPLITLAATLTMLFLLYTWLKYFNVAAWVPKVVMVLGILAGLGAGFGVVNAVIATVRGFGSGGGSAAVAGVEMSGDAAEAVKKAQEAAAKMAESGNLTAEQQEAMKQAAELAKAAGGNAEEALKKAQEAAAKAAQGMTPEQQELVRKAQEAAAKMAAESGKAGEAAAKAAEEAVAAAEKAAEKTAEKTEKAVEKAEATEKAAAKAAEKVLQAAPVEEPDEPSEPAPAAAAASATGGSFKEFLRKREAFETALQNDPFLIRKPGIKEKYSAYLKKTFDIRGKYAKKKKSDPVTERITDREKDIEVYEQTRKMVDELYEKIVVNK